MTGTRTLDANAYDLDQYGAEVLLSKGFTLVTPYIGAGVVYSRGKLRLASRLLARGEQHPSGGLCRGDAQPARPEDPRRGRERRGFAGGGAGRDRLLR